jgi:hypothetical protein
MSRVFQLPLAPVHDRGLGRPERAPRFCSYSTNLHKYTAFQENVKCLIRSLKEKLLEYRDNVSPKDGWLFQSTRKEITS